MARREGWYVVAADGKRDAGKRFKMREMSAAAIEDWAMRAFLALAAAGINIPDEVISAGAAALQSVNFAQIGLNGLGKISHGDAKPLLDEMLACVTVCPDPTNMAFERALVDTDIEEVMTRVKLRMEVWKLHVGFYEAVASQSTGVAAAAVSQ